MYNQQFGLNHTTQYGVSNNQQCQPPTMGGQFYQHTVEQGQGVPYSQGVAGYNPYMTTAWVPMNDKMVSLPMPMLQIMEANLTAVVQRTQNNNMTVALSVLQSAVYCFLQFERAFKTLFHKGDDNTQLYNLAKCVAELKQANASQQTTATATHWLGWLVTNEDPVITNTRELFEQCIKVIEEFQPCLSGRITETYTHEKMVQIYAGWRGWQQQAEQVRVSNQALGRLLQKFLAQDSENATYKEIRCFQQSVSYAIDSFFLRQYPKADVIEAIYSGSGFEFITEVKEHYHSLQDITTGVDVEESNEDAKKPGFLSSLWGNGSDQQ